MNPEKFIDDSSFIQNQNPILYMSAVEICKRKINDQRNCKNGYQGKTYTSGKVLFDLIENIAVNEPPSKENVLQVQTVIRPKLAAYHDYRGFAGKVKSGSFSVGDAIEVFPSGTKTKIKSIEQYGVNQEQVSQGQNATLLLEDEVNVSMTALRIFYQE